MNESMRELQEVLLGRVQALSRQLDDAKTTKEAEAIVREMLEFNHRVTLTGQLLFREQSKQLTARVEAVKKAKSEVDSAIKKLSNLKTGVKIVTKFLHLVDEALDLAKVLAVA
jgi:hypothetical protein